ncbi:alpha/beta fold hydrolase [Leucobacter sp. BZR 635]
MERISDARRLEEVLEPFTGKTWQAPGGTVNYSLLGEARNGTVLLVAGLSMQRTEWSPELIAGLHAAGYATLAADNRDCGLTRLRGGTAASAGAGEASPDTAKTGEAKTAEASSRATYSLRDMAGDLRDLLVHLGVGPVHVLGMSMGGMIAQHLALLAPEQVVSLTSLMSTSGSRAVGRPQERAKWVFLTPAPTDSLESYVDYAVRYHVALAGEQMSDIDRARHLAIIAWERGVNREGTARQLAAIQADGDRTERLESLRLPALVVHGDADPLIGISGGIATAAAIPGAEMHTITGMGHSVPWQCAGSLTERVVAHFAAAA